MQTVMLERFLEETEKCPPEPKCEKFKPCPGKRKSSSKMNHEGKSLKEKKISLVGKEEDLEEANAVAKVEVETQTAEVVEEEEGKELVENGSDDESIIGNTVNGDIENKHYFDAIPRYQPGPASPAFEPSSNEGVSFKIFVYNLPPKFHVEMLKKNKRCVTDQYGTEIRIHANIMQSKMYTLDPLEAEFFYVPVYGECKLFENIATLGAKKGLQETNAWWLEAMKLVTDQYPFWNRTQGRDHVFTFAGARGPHIFKDWKRHIKKSIFLTPEGDRSLSEQFNTWKDIVIPGLEPDSEFIDGKLRKQSSLKKDIFAFFRGTILNKAGILAYSRGIRPKMEAAFKKHKDVIFTEEIPSCDRDCYRKELRKSTFCLCPRGWSPWTLRAYQAMMVGCIPVIIADEIELPYENSLDWTKLSVKIAEVDAEKTIDILKQISKSEIRNKQKAIEKVWKSVAWGSNPKKLDPMDAMECVLHELGRKKRAMKASTQTFWFE